MAGTLTPTPFQTVLDDTGVASPAALIYTYTAGTTTAAATYTTSALSVANANPIVADSAGRYVAYLAAGANMKFVFKTAAGATIRTQDNVLSVPGAAVNLDIQGTVGVAVTAGQVCYLSSGAEATPLTPGLWYLTDADFAVSSTTCQSIGMAVSAIPINAVGTIRIAGLATTAAAVVVGSTYYVSATAGAITTTAPALARVVGVADTTSTLILAATSAVAATLPNPISQDLLFTDATYDIGKSGASRPRDLFQSRNATIGGTLGVTGATTLSSTLGVTGATTLSSTLASGALTVTGAATVSTTLGVTGATTLSSTVATGALTVTGNETVSGTLGVTGATTLSSTLASGALTVTGNETVSGTLGVTGATTLSSTLASGALTVTGNETVSGTLGVTGATTLSSTLASGALTVTGNETVSGTLGVTGATSLSSATMSSTLDVTGAATLASTLAVTGATTLTGGLTLSGAIATPTTITLSDDVIFTGNKVIRRNTSDGSDSGFITLAGGGARSQDRGAFIDVYGNENTNPGVIYARIGNVSGAYFAVDGPGVGDALKILGSNGSATFTTAGSGFFKATGVYNLTDAGAANIVVLSDGSLKRSTSSARYKTNIKDLTDWRWLLSVRPVTFNSLHAPNGRRYGGLIAEDVAAANADFAVFDTDGRPDEVAYGHLAAPIIKAIQELAGRLHAAGI